MTKEERLKEYILDRYGSMREFTIAVDMPYSTVASVLKRGIDGSSVANVFKICNALGISPDELSQGKISPTVDHIAQPGEALTEVNEIISDTKARLLNYSNLTLGGKPVDQDTINALVQGIDLSLEMIKKGITKPITKT